MNRKISLIAFIYLFLPLVLPYQPAPSQNMTEEQKIEKLITFVANLKSATFL
jgi:hypothetical protein